MLWGREKQDLAFYLPINVIWGREKTRSHFFPTPKCYIGVGKNEISLFPTLKCYIRVGKRQDLGFPYPLMLYRGREKTRSHFLPTPKCYMGYRKNKISLVFLVILLYIIGALGPNKCQKLHISFTTEGNVQHIFNFFFCDFTTRLPQNPQKSAKPL